MSCVCGHSEEEHGHDPEYPGSTACQGVFDNGAGKDEKCPCCAFEEDDEYNTINPDDFLL